MIIDLHNHTPLCNHAEGKPNEYIKAAIKKGINIFGFSDHAPMSFDPEYRMSANQLQDYFKEIESLKDRHNNQIEILTGLEVDYLPKFHDEKVLNADIDYLIGSVHFLQDWGFDNPEFIGRYEREDIDEIWRLYFREIESMAKSRLFQIVGHIDLIKVFKFFPKHTKIEDLVEPSLKAIKESGMAIEINGAGYRKPVAEPYPSFSILQMVYDMDIPITFGSDAHSPEQVGKYLQKIMSEAKKIGFKEAVIFRKKRLESFKI